MRVFFPRLGWAGDASLKKQFFVRKMTTVAADRDLLLVSGFGIFSL